MTLSPLLFSTAPRDRARTPADVLSEAERILDRGATLDNSETLYLAAARPEPTAEFRAKLRCWAEIFPRLPVRPLSEEATERILYAAALLTHFELELLKVADILRAGPDAAAVEARAQELAARYASAGSLEVRQLAARDTRELLEHRVANAQQHADAAREALIRTLRGAR
jgi:hypothetical protein